MESLLLPKKYYLIRERGAEYDYRKKQDQLAAINHLAAGLAHEIRNPLTEVLGFVQLLESSLSPTEKQKEYLESAYKGIEAINTIVAEASLLGNTVSLRTRPVSVVILLNDLRERVEPLAKKMGVPITFILTGPLPMVKADPLPAVRALFNVVTNALEASLTGSEVTVTAKFQSLKKMVVIEICDTGTGIDENCRDFIFDPFFSTKPSGTGLGLSTALYVIKIHGGNLRFFSQPGKGSSFIVELPAFGE